MITKEEKRKLTISRKKKIERLTSGSTPRLLDIFSGCGGITLGFHRAGFEITAGVEFDKHASLSHALNFHSDVPDNLFEKHAQAKDITKIEPSHLTEMLELGCETINTIDVLVGGPPCQAFARVGRSKLREVYEHPEAFLSDPRSNLYLRYLDYVKEFNPIALVMENVPDVLNFGGHNIAEEVCETLENLGYNANYTLLNAVHYGVPEMRERMFLIAYAQELEAPIEFPEPTNWMELPRGYHGSRQVALQTISTGLFDESHHYVEPPEPKDSLPKAVTAEDALKDLPVIPDDHPCRLKKAPQRFDTIARYPRPVHRENGYAKLMRTEWPNFSSKEGVYDHVIRYLPRDYKLFAVMNPGDQYPEAHAHATKMFEDELIKLKKQGTEVRKGTKKYNELRDWFVPPYDPSKFPNKWRKMEPDQPARTLMAHLGKDSYSHIHYCSKQARTISVREAARLQSFPDGFKFAGSMNPAFKQIGNAVPPLMAFALAKEIYKKIKKG